MKFETQLINSLLVKMVFESVFRLIIVSLIKSRFVYLSVDDDGLQIYDNPLSFDMVYQLYVFIAFNQLSFMM